MFCFRTMGSLPIDNYVTIDHTFKVAVNIDFFIKKMEACRIEWLVYCE